MTNGEESPRNSLYENTLTLASPADRPVRAPRARRRLHHRRSYPWRRPVHRRTGMQTPAPFPVTRAAPDRRPRLTAGKPTAGVAGHSHSLLRQPPPRVAARGRCRGSRCGLPPASSRLDTRPARAPVNASPPPLRVAAHDSGPPWVATTALPVCRRTRRTPRTGGAHDTQRTARTRGVSPGEPGESHAARLTNSTQTGRPRCGREGSQGAALRSAILSTQKRIRGKKWFTKNASSSWCWRCWCA